MIAKFPRSLSIIPIKALFQFSIRVKKPDKMVGLPDKMVGMLESMYGSCSFPDIQCVNSITCEVFGFRSE